MLNEVMMVGRCCTKEPYLRYTSNGLAVAGFTLAVKRGAQNQTQSTDYIPVVAWQSLARACASELGKGRMVAVDGRLKIGFYKDKRGVKRQGAEVVAHSIRVLDRDSEKQVATRVREVSRERDQGEKQQLEQRVKVANELPLRGKPAIVPEIRVGSSVAPGIGADGDRYKNTAVLLEEFDAILRDGGNQRNSLLRIVAYYMKGKALEDNAGFLAGEYKTGGKGFQFGEDKVAVWFDSRGIAVGRGGTAVHSLKKHLFSWEDVASRISELLGAGQYVDTQMIEDALPNERKELAERLWFFYRDYGNMPEAWRTEKGGFQDDQGVISELLSNVDSRDEIIRTVEADVAELAGKEGNAKRNGMLEEILRCLRDLQIEPVKYTAGEIAVKGFVPFITEDEIDAFFTYYTPSSQGKYRILSYYLQEQSKEERANFVKGEYKNAGCSHALSGADGSWFDGSGNKIILERKGRVPAFANLTWAAAAERIGRLIKDGRYMASDELESIPDYEISVMARSVASFYSGLPLEIERPYTIALNNWQGERGIEGLLREPVNVTRIADSMEMAISTIGKDDRKYEMMKEAFLNLLKYEKGEYSLFPGLGAIGIAPLQEKPHEVQLSIIDFMEDGDDQEEIGLAVAEVSGEQKDGEEALSYNAGVTEEPCGEPVSVVAPAATGNNSPPPVFVVNWDEAEPDFDLNLYQDHDVIAYDLEGVEYQLGRSGSLVYVTSTGSLWGDNEVPGDIKEQIDCFMRGDLCGELVRENYLDVLRTFKEKKMAHEAPTDAFETAGQEWPEEPGPQEDLLDGPKEQGCIDGKKPQEFASANYRITDDLIGEGGVKEKYRANAEAIRALFTIEAENRGATPEEQELLARYVGWGGLPQAFDQDNRDWRKEYAELSDLLSPEEYASARTSTLNAHYTSPVVIKAMYETVGRLGFRRGNILEPSCGVGNFFGLLPDGMKGARLYGVELDNITARIAKLLYPKADIREMGYEKTGFPDSFFDLVIGNVPFGNYRVADKRYDKHKFHLHDYFFAKALDQVRPGGIIAFITSKYTLDKKNAAVRKYIAQRAELLGAVRLPENVFMKNAGTITTMDVIFLQKRDRVVSIEPEWAYIGATPDGVPVNRYYADNPGMLLGNMALDDKMNNKYGRGDMTTCKPIEGADLGEQLRVALGNVRGSYIAESAGSLEVDEGKAIPADPRIRNFSFALVTTGAVDGQLYAAKIGEGGVYYRENTLMRPVELSDTALERVRGLLGLRDCVQKLIALQLDEHSEEEIKGQQGVLNSLYDEFTAKYGLINSRANSRVFEADSSYYLLASLEIINEDGKLERKADMFDKRTIKQNNVATHVDTAAEALAVSLGEKARVDLEFMAELTGRSEAALFEELRGVVFADYDLDVYNNNIKQIVVRGCVYRDAGEFLSGNVREKLQKYQEAFETITPDSAYFQSISDNVEALKAVQPKELEASEISVRLGSTWLPKEYVRDFMYEIFQTPAYIKRNRVIDVQYSGVTGEWKVTNKTRLPYGDVASQITYGTGRINAYGILEAALNLRDIRIYDKRTIDGREKRNLNRKETTIAQQKQEAIKQAFKDWVWQEPERQHTLVRIYNERFNSIRPREYDGSHINYNGISPAIELKSHQRDAVARILYGGNTLLAHEVGAGKTYVMVAAAMELKRLGLCQKSLFTVPKHLTEQWAAEFMRLYPAANILVVTEKDFETSKRKMFCAKIATGDYDAVIIGHSQLEKIPMSRERQKSQIYAQIQEIEDGIQEMKQIRNEQYTVKQMERTKRSLEARLVKLLEAKERDDVVNFEELGIDRLFVDEAHMYKNLFLYTKMRNVAGISQSEAQKSSDLFMKCRYLDEITGNKGVVFATGTPVSNSMTEMYTMQRYLQYDLLMRKELKHFDAWASTFGETTTAIELAPEGNGYRARTRFAKFNNLPELMAMFREVADIKTAEQLDLPRPKARYETIAVKPTEHQVELVQSLSERAAAIQAKMVSPDLDNMLKITTDGRKIGLDQRLSNPLLPDEPGSKVNACVNNVYGIWQRTSDQRLTQAIFCDFSTPNKDGRFNVYDDIKSKLVVLGVPEDEIAFIHDASSGAKKKELFAKVRKGKVRIIMGSTFKMGSGTNIQDKLIALHELDCPWRPSDLEQRGGRIVRQGNRNPEVFIFRYVTESTFDSYLYQTIENKQRFISQIMTSKSPARSCEDIDESVLSYAEIKALCAGNPLIKEKMDLDIDVSRLRLLKAEHLNQRHRLEDNLIKHLPLNIQKVKASIAGYEKDISALAVVGSKGGYASMEILGVNYREKGDAGTALLDVCKTVKGNVPTPIGRYRNYAMCVEFKRITKEYVLTLIGNMSYDVPLGSDQYGNLTRIDNAIARIPEMLAAAKERLGNLQDQVESAKAEIMKPFPQEAELEEKIARLALVDAELNLSGKDEETDGGTEEEVVNIEVEPGAAGTKSGVEVDEMAV